MICPCGSGQPHDACCGVYLSGQAWPDTAEALMRARYSAYTQANLDFILHSTHPDGRQDSDVDAMRAWAEAADWQGLEVLRVEKGQATDSVGTVEFIARYLMNGVPHHHHEIAEFRRMAGSQAERIWAFRDGQTLHSGPSEKPKPVTVAKLPGRNDPCLCGSGKKYKKCCGA